MTTSLSLWKVTQYHQQHRLAGLACSQKEQVRELMREEISVFSVTNKDIGCVKTSQMKLNLKDQVLVQQNCNSTPKQFYSDME